jgi:hypothetical protein
MGLLQNADYWRHVASGMFDIRPIPNRKMSKEDTVEFLTIACRALVDLVHDPEVRLDLEKAASIVRDGKIPNRSSEGFDDFLSEFERAEASLLLQSGMNFDCAADIVQELRTVAKTARSIKPTAVSGLLDLLASLQNKTCSAADEARKGIRQEKKSGSIWQAIKGFASIGVDSATAAGAFVIDPVITGPVAIGTIGAASIAYGTVLVQEAKKSLDDL